MSPSVSPQCHSLNRSENVSPCSPKSFKPVRFRSHVPTRKRSRYLRRNLMQTIYPDDDIECDRISYALSAVPETDENAPDLNVVDPLAVVNRTITRKACDLFVEIAVDFAFIMRRHIFKARAPQA